MQKSAPRPRQLRLPIDYAPAVVRAHGYAAAHSYPLVSLGKNADGSFASSFRVSPARAWDFPSIELRTANARPVIIFDIDSEPAFRRACLRWRFDKDLPTPNWTVQRVAGGAHAVYTLVSPVAYGPNMRERPFRLLSRVSEYLGMQLHADAGYAGVLSHNPVFGGDLVTEWGPTWGYELSELAECIPEGWRRPRLPRTELGRNCALFDAGLRWAGSAHNLDHGVLEPLLALNGEFAHPLADGEVRGIARSVERYRSRWITQGRFYSDAERTAWGRERGIRSGRARRKRTASRDAEVVRLSLEGLSQRQIAAATGVSQRMVNYVLRRSDVQMAFDAGDT